MMTILQGIFHSVVSPIEKPTVLKAETASKRASSKSKWDAGSKRKTIIAVRKVSTIASVKTFDAFTRHSGSTRLWKMTTSFLPRIHDQSESRRSPMVVVRMPPAVETGAAPMNMKSMMISPVALFMAWISKRVKPAMREEIDMKKALCHFSAVLRCPSVAGLLPSRRK